MERGIRKWLFWLKETNRIEKGGNVIELRKYLLEKGVIVTDKSFRAPIKYKEEEVLKQIILVKTLHDSLMAYSIYGTTRINSTIGKFIESIKVEVKKCRWNYHELYSKKEKNIMDEFLLNNGEIVLKKGEETITFLKEIDYIGLIKRSMKKNEICLGRVDEGNIRALEEIEIGTLKNISYNLVEEDIYDYLRKIRRKNPESNLDMYADKYIEDAFLGENSRAYLKVLISMPYDTIRNWRRYSLNKKQISPNEYINIMKKSIEYEIGI